MKRNNNFSYKIVVRGNSEEERDIFFVDTLEDGATILNTTFFSKFPIISRSMLSNYCYKQEYGFNNRISVFKERVK
tara:strand:+ start:1915 stop:2142 length:228 start_codon:yes stop_codon:yes gene_type:complete